MPIFNFARPVTALLALALGMSCLPAVEQQAPAQNSATPPTPSVLTETSAGDLLKDLPPVPSLVEREGKALWTGEDPSLAYRVTAVDKDGNALIATDIGELTVARKLLVDNRIDAITALPALIAHAKGAQVKADGLVLREGILTGIHLFSAQTLVIFDGVLTRTKVTAPERDADRGAVVKAVAIISAELKKTSTFDEPGKRSVEDVLQRLAKADGKEDADEVAPSFARRLVRGGWLRKLLPNQAAAVTALEQAIVAAEKYHPVNLYEGTGLRLAEVSDSFERGSRWVLTTPTRAAYVQPHEKPLYYWSLNEPGPTLAVDMQPGVDPLAVNDKVIGVRLLQAGTLLAAWNKTDGLTANLKNWRQAYPIKSLKGVENAAANFMPPHILLTALNGDIVRLYTEKGVLEAPADGSSHDAERFLAQAAKSLPDPAHLDLIGEYIFSYVYDSPDSRYPFLVGNRQIKGEIHQTAVQTISTATGGMIRGDCDDLSELYQAIAERQGRSAYVISLPGHAAMAFAEKKEDKNWHAYVLQTGPPLEFSDATLPQALEKLYKKFDENDAFDPNGLGLLLRFSGENTRGSWRLSWRIFSDPDYAKTMIDVQRDWQYQTYQRAIAKMKKMIADGDDDNANFRELSGLYGFTGQYDLAVKYHQQAIERTVDLENRLNLSVELVQYQFDSKHDDQARTTTLSILNEQLPKLKKDPKFKAKIAATQGQLGIQLAATLIHGKAFDLALRAIKDTQLEDMAAKITTVGEWINSENFDERKWDNSPQLMGLRRQFLMYTFIAMEILEGVSSDELTTNADLQLVARSVQDWLTNIAFHDVDEPEDSLARYSIAGRFYGAMLGKESLMKLIDGVELPKVGERDHTKRIGGLAQLKLDLPWIKLSVPFWSAQVMELFAKERTTLDNKQVAKLAKQVKDSYDASKALGLEHHMFERDLHLVQVLSALASQDGKLLRERLKWVKEKDDKRLRDDTAQWLGDASRFTALDWYQQVIQIWKDELNYKPKYYWIAWRAALNDAPQHALKVAEFAKNEFKDDPSFSEEYDYMKALFDQPAKPVPAPEKLQPAAK